jgi:glycerol-3-phosphate dehydrogenase
VLADPEGFPYLEAQLRFSIRTQMVYHLEDFYLRRTALYASRKDHGLPWAERLSTVWAEEWGLGEGEALLEKTRLEEELRNRSAWLNQLSQ